MFTLNPGQYTMKFWTAKVHDQELLIEWVGEPGNRDGAERHLYSHLDEFDAHLDRSRPQIEKYNAGLRGSAEMWVAERKAKVLKDRNMEAELGFPIRRRKGAATYPVPVRRKMTIRHPRPTATSPFEPEPALDAADYE
ncbi:MAG TPA: hypothetical protein VLH10_13070, partial [Yinghuangia sp.]|nr:hypothetical protein [Yinghuangia sp.]